MPRYKRWFHVNQDILDDPEFQALSDTFGAAGIKFFLLIMALLEKTENHFPLNLEINLKHWAARIGSTRKQCASIYQLLIDYQWISVGLTEDQKTFLFARNYMKYRGNQAHENEMTKNVSCSPPLLAFTYKEKNQKKVPRLVPKKGDSEAFEWFWKAFPSRNGKKLGKPEAQSLYLELTEEDKALAIQAAKNYSESEMVKDGVGIKDPKRFLKNGKGFESWRDWIEPEVSQNRKGELLGCSKRIETNGRFKPCGKPATKAIRQNPLCDDCHAAYLKGRQTLKGKGESSAN